MVADLEFNNNWNKMADHWLQQLLQVSTHEGASFTNSLQTVIQDRK